MTVSFAASLTLDPGARVGPVDRRLFGSFVEHMGRCVYTGIFEPGHPAADERGIRGDVLDLVRELGVTVVRYPGGNFVSGYRWEDGVGPVADRPRRLDLAWHAIEPNTFGTDEFVAWCRRAGVEPMLALNLGLGGTRGALDLLEYANYPGGTTLSDARVANGAPEPHDVRLWCLGNEADGPWQLGHRSAADVGEYIIGQPCGHLIQIARNPISLAQPLAGDHFEAVCRALDTGSLVRLACLARVNAGRQQLACLGLPLAGGGQTHVWVGAQAQGVTFARDRPPVVPAPPARAVGLQ